MATLLEPTPSLSRSDFVRLAKDLDENQHDRIAKEEKERLRNLVRRVLANSTL